MPTATSFTFSFNWSNLVGLFNALMGVMNSPTALLVSLALVLGVGLIVYESIQLGKEKGRKSARLKASRHVTGNYAPLALGDVIDIPALPAPRPARNVTELVSDDGETFYLPAPAPGALLALPAPAPPATRPATPRRVKRACYPKKPKPKKAKQPPAPPPAPRPGDSEPISPDELPTPVYGFGLPAAPLDLDAVLAQVEETDKPAEAAEISPDELPTPAYSFGIPALSMDLDAALEQVEEADRQAEAARQATEISPDELPTPTYGFGLPAASLDLDAALAQVDEADRQAEAAHLAAEISPDELPALTYGFGLPPGPFDLDAALELAEAADRPADEPAVGLEPAPDNEGVETQNQAAAPEPVTEPGAVTAPPPTPELAAAAPTPAPPPAKPRKKSKRLAKGKNTVGPARSAGPIDLANSPEATQNTLIQESEDLSHERPDSRLLSASPEHAQPLAEPGDDHPHPLAEVPAQDVPEIGGAGATGPGDPDSGGPDDGSGPGVDQPGDALMGSLDAGAGGMGDPADGGGYADTWDLPLGVADAGDNGRRLAGDYRIGEADQVGAGGAKQKYRDNVAAIRLLKQLEAAGRKANPEEQAVLVKYVGWGGLAKVFDHYEGATWNKNAQWREEYHELKELLTPEEYQAARASTPNAHYTSPQVISAMWQGLEWLGFKGGRVLEPAAGVGHFFGLMPEQVARRSTKLASELDSLSGRITQQLYQSAEVRIGGFEQSNLPNNFVDLAISNVPFGNYGVHDPDFKRERKFLTRSLHNYFFAKALDKVKPGGVVAFVTSRYTMDSKDPRVREYLSGQADLVGAIRLPNTAFKENAMTDVTTDIIFLRKRAAGQAPSDVAWVKAETQTDAEDKEYRLNEYFGQHPDMMLGTMQVTGNMYQESADLVPDDRNLKEALAEAIERLPAGILDQAKVVPDEDTISQPPPFYEKRAKTKVPRIREGSYFVDDDDKVYRRQNGFDVEVQPSPNAKTAQKNLERLKGLTAIRAAARDLLDLNLAGAGDEDLETGQARLNAAYDEFSGKFGPINLKANQSLIKDDPDLPFMLALEKYDEDSKTALKAAIFRDRVIGIVSRPDRADTAKDALLISMNEYGAINWERMSQLTGKTEAQLIEELDEVLYPNPEGGWETADSYLSGNVRGKLKAAAAAAALDPAYQRNVEALRQQLPRDLKPSDITASLGVGWIPEEVVSDFVSRLVGVRLQVRYLDDLAQWIVEDGDKYTKSRLASSYANQTEWGTSRFTALELLEMALNAKQPTAYDKIQDAEGNERRVINQGETNAAREQQGKIKAKFGEWLWADPAQADKLADIYNERFNTFVPRQYEGSHLNFPGMAADIHLRGHQKDAIWRILQGDSNTLLAHEVGAGKTFTMIAAGMELRRLGLRKKVMHAVPNNILEQYAADFQRLYPGARVLAIDPEDLSPKKRKETMSRIATEDWDAVIVSHTSLSKLPVKDETFNTFLNQQIQILEDYMLELKKEDEKGNKLTIKELEKAKKRLEAKLRDRRDEANKDDGLTWEELGIDHLFVDEADKYKNLYFPTKRGRVAGIGGSESGRAFDMYIKSRNLGQGGLTFATGTPIANSVSEMYTMQRYLQEDVLAEQGLAHFDAWANMYGDTVTAMEMKPTGSGYRVHTRFARFQNVPELLRAYGQVADVEMDLDALGIQRPRLKGSKPRAITVEPSEEQKAYIKVAEKRADSLGHVDPREDNMLKIVGDVNKAALDMRLIDPDLPDDPNSKVNAVVDKALDVYERTSGVELPNKPGQTFNLTQMIFLDISTPDESGEGFNVYRDMKQKLIKGGVPEPEVAFIHDAKTDEEKLKLIEQMNSGEIRILIGSTEKMGAGTNAQRLLYALHHVDAPWRPRDITQREGRILRQGNFNPEVEVYRYATEGSFDVYKWQTLETKAKFIAQINNADLDERIIEDIDSAAIGYAEMKALATGNPIIIEQIKVKTDLQKYESLLKAHNDRRYDLQRELRDLPPRIEQAQVVAASYRALLADRDLAGTELLEPVGLNLGELAEKAIAGEQAELALYDRPARVELGSSGPQLVVKVGEGLNLSFRVTKQEKLNTSRLQEMFGADLENRLAKQEALIDELERNQASYEAEIARPFEHTETLKSLRIRAAGIQAEVDRLNAGQPQQVFDESTFGTDTEEVEA